jgi:toxin ParE1/3/4
VARNWRVTRSRAAKADLFEIWSYIAANDIDAADRWLQRIVASIDRLSAFPSLGRTRAELPNGILAFSLRPYMLIYKQRPEEQLVEIIRVIDARRDFSSLFL